jgi:hypothetical protein
MKQDLAIILIFVHKPSISSFEKASLIQCFKVLGHHPIKLVCPTTLDTRVYSEIVPSIEIDFINPRWQSSYQMYSRLKVSRFLYDRYKRYEFILVYELDAFVFQDELEYWCSQGYDYIGAPWFEGFDEATSLSPLIGVGNGGFSLRRVDAALKALHRFSILDKDKAKKDWELWKSRGNHLKGLLSIAKSYTITNNSFYLFNEFEENAEDIFWGKYINRNFDWFNVAPVDQALKFSFEVNPKLLFAANNNSLPFGCHAWWKYDFDFWLPHIQKSGYLKDLSI